VAEAGFRGQEHRRPPLGVDVPVPDDPLGRLGRQFPQVLGLQHARCDRRAGHRAITVRPDPVEPDLERIPGFGAVHEKRSGLRVARHRYLTLAGIPAAGINGYRNDGVAWIYTKNGVMRPDCGMIFSRFKLVPCHY